MPWPREHEQEREDADHAGERENGKPGGGLPRDAVDEVACALRRQAFAQRHAVSSPLWYLTETIASAAQS